MLLSRSLDDAIANLKAEVFGPLVPEVVHHEVVLGEVQTSAEGGRRCISIDFPYNYLL